jgi:hypothetical protein
LQEWVRTLIEARPYTIEFRTGQGSFVDFSARRIVVEPNMPDTLAPAARELPTTWGHVPLARTNQLQVLCARALAWHEAAHVLFTAPGTAAAGIHHTLVNFLEDERIERLVVRYYPPAATDLEELGRRLWLQGCVDAPDRATRLLNATLYHRWDADRSPGEATRLVLAEPDDRAVWEGRIRPLVEEAWIAPDTARVAQIALQILDIIGVPPSSPLSRFPGLMAGAGSGTDRLTRGQRAPEDDPLPATARGWGGTDDAPAETDAASRAGGGHDPDVDGELASEAADVDPSHGVLWMQPFDELECAVAPEVRRLQEELRVRASSMDPEPNRYRGRFDAHALRRSRGERPLLRPALEGNSPAGLAVMLVIDGTSSNGGDPGGVTPDNRPANPTSFHNPGHRMPHVRRAAMLLQRACAGLGIPCAIAEACDGWFRVHDPSLPHRSASPVTWLQRWDTDPHAEGPRAMIAGLYGHAGKEEVCRSLDICAGAFRPRPEGTKLLLYLHDGMPNDPIERIQATLARVRVSGITVVGLYIGPQDDLARMQVIFGQEWTIGAGTLSELPARVGRILKRYRTGR